MRTGEIIESLGTNTHESEQKLLTKAEMARLTESDYAIAQSDQEVGPLIAQLGSIIFADRHGRFTTNTLDL